MHLELKEKNDDNVEVRKGSQVVVSSRFFLRVRGNVTRRRNEEQVFLSSQWLLKSVRENGDCRGSSPRELKLKGKTSFTPFLTIPFFVFLSSLFSIWREKNWRKFSVPCSFHSRRSPYLQFKTFSSLFCAHTHRRMKLIVVAVVWIWIARNAAWSHKKAGTTFSLRIPLPFLTKKKIIYWCSNSFCWKKENPPVNSRIQYPM